MKTLYEKSCNKKYFEKYDKNGNLLRTAEQFESGFWIVHIYKGVDIRGEYSNSEFKKIKKYFN